MAHPPVRHTMTSRWMRVCRQLWRILKFFWSGVVLVLALSILSVWLITKSFDLSGTPLAWIFVQHWPLVLACGGALAVLSAVVFVPGRQERDASTAAAAQPSLESEPYRSDLIRLLRNEYRSRLAQSLQGAGMMAVEVQKRTDLTLSEDGRDSWSMGTPGERSLAAHASIVQEYDEAGPGLLMLGAPGAGKSTLLRQLASELLTRAEQHDKQRVPVILNLSSWASKRPPLTVWLVDQMQLVYGISRRLGRAWIEQDQLLLLLDGLDEVDATARPACIETINAYLAEHSMSLVVCSRSQEYLAQADRLRLPAAVEVQPIAPGRVDGYLRDAGKPLAAVRAALRGNAVLHELIKTPLMLSVVMLAYRDKKAGDLPRPGPAEEQQRQVFEYYVTRMLEQRGRQRRYTSQQTRKWLTWLAGQMKQHQLTEFYLESLQPTWLSTKRPRSVYAVISGGAFGLAGGMLLGLIGLLIGGLIGGLVGGPVNMIIGGLIGLLIGGLIGGLELGLIGWIFGRLGRLNVQKPTWSWKSFWRWPGRKEWDIRPVEKLSWSWRPFWQGLFYGLVISVFSCVLVFGLLLGIAGMLGGGSSTGLPADGPGGGLLFGLEVGLVFGLMFGPIGGLVSGLRSGLSNAQIDEHTRLRPNQGIRSSRWNALRIWLASWLVFGLLGALVGVLGGALGGELLGGLAIGLLSGLGFGLIFGLSFGLIYGGLAYLQHYCLRLLLWSKRAMPWRVVRFLEEANEHILLQRVGGGYRFIHPLFQDYFASLDKAAPAPVVQPT
jgi:NACHT domain